MDINRFYKYAPKKIYITHRRSVSASMKIPSYKNLKTLCVKGSFNNDVDTKFVLSGKEGFPFCPVLLYQAWPMYEDRINAGF